MAYTNKIPAAAAVATAMLFLAVMIAPRWTEAQTMPKLDPVCAVLITGTITKCYLSGSLTPSDECCSDLKSATDRQVTCLCDNFIAHPSNNNVTQALLEVYHNDCGVADKFACKGSSNGGATKKIGASIGLLGLAARNSNGGAVNKISASIGLLGLAASLFFF